MKTKGFAIAFVCQKGKLEQQSCLLVASIRKYYGKNIDLIACVPQPEEIWGTPSEATLSYLCNNDVEITTVENNVGVHYPVGNKLNCLQSNTTKNRIAFLDTDVLCMSYRSVDSLVNTKDVQFVAATRSHPTNVQWHEIYNLFNLTEPESVFHTLSGGKSQYPYANSGFIVCNSGTSISKKWTNNVLKLQETESIDDKLKYPYSDQITLPLTLYSENISFNFISPAWNFPSWLWRTDISALPVFYHYQRASTISTDINAYHLYLNLLRNDNPRCQNSCRLI